jgi:hypothetical protein
MPTVQTENKPLDPKVMANEIINAAVGDVTVEINGVVAQRLEVVIRYLNRDKISARGERWFTKNHDSLMTDAVEELINARSKAITKYQDKKENDGKRELFLVLLTKGISFKDAVQQSGYNPDMDNENLEKQYV